MQIRRGKDAFLDLMTSKYLPSISSLFFFAHFFRTNVLFGSFFSYVSALAPKFCTKNARVNVDEIDGWRQFYKKMKLKGLN